MNHVRNLTSILVIRPDRMGDVVLSTPVLEVLRQNYPDAKITFLVQKNIIPLLKGSRFVDEFFIWEPEGKHSGIKGFIKLLEEIREKQFKIAISLQSELKIAAALFGAGVPYRVGPLSKIHSYLFYNRGVRQRRSHVEMHEADYNLQLLRRIGIRTQTRSVPVQVFLNQNAQTWAKKHLTELGVQLQRPFVVVHPGMGGSALNWPETYYADLVKKLSGANVQVLLTGGPTEGELIERLLSEIPNELKANVFTYKAEIGRDVSYLVGVLNEATLVVAPSTGPLHIAVALNKKVVTFYPPIKVQSAIRWGPYLSDESRSSVFVPEVYCGQDYKCIGNHCNYFPCMKTVTVEEVFEEIKKVLYKNEVGKTHEKGN